MAPIRIRQKSLAYFTTLLRRPHIPEQLQMMERYGILLSDIENKRQSFGTPFRRLLYGV